ncbi:uncharacterized protein LOC129779645 [Toxorhynchites rutilus septentrionalis]|uniref:uncharacterized protein LOC129779645 n=1 Tax=Toxorhynchites rutilus septentrionalis TaxID=329112 RepID=UPI00247A772A|nr:uncharacterized protein LOC129779645 [Toxorhynchites rutilus septentrionalis]
MKVEVEYELDRNRETRLERVESTLQHVEGDDDSEDYTEEEMLLYADFENYLSQEELTDPNVRVKIVGIESENPIIQVNNDIYKGTYDFAVGTNVFFEEDSKGKASIDPLYSANPEKLYKYVGQSTKVLTMKRIFITPKTEQVKTEPGTAAEITRDNASQYTVTHTYEEALNMHLPEGHYPPRHIEQEHNCEKVVKRKTTKLTMVESDVEDDAMRDDPRDADFRPGGSK